MLKLACKPTSFVGLQVLRRKLPNMDMVRGTRTWCIFPDRTAVSKTCPRTTSVFCKTKRAAETARRRMHVGSNTIVPKSELIFLISVFFLNQELLVL